MSNYNTLLRTKPSDARPRYTAYYMTLMNIGAFVCPMLSVALVDWIGLGPMLVIAGALSILGSTSFWWNPVIRQEEVAQVVTV